eukprot:5970235-Amphidinium_carterae.1
MHPSEMFLHVSGHVLQVFGCQTGLKTYVRPKLYVQIWTVVPAPSQLSQERPNGFIRKRELLVREALEHPCATATSGYQKAENEFKLAKGCQLLL